MMKTAAAICSLLAALAGPAGAGFVQTTDGKSHVGDVRFDGEGNVTVRSDQGTPTTLPLKTVRRAVFASGADAAAAVGVVPDGWKALDIGRVGLAGQSGWSGGKWLLQVGGAEIGPNADFFHYVYTRLSGDGEITVRATGLKSDDRQGRGGIMFRERAQPESRFAALLVKADGTYTFRQRSTSGQGVTQVANAGFTLPGWIKLVRKKNQYSAFKSGNGQSWEATGNAAFDSPGEMLVGLAIASRNAATRCSMSMENLRLSRAGSDGKTQLIELKTTTDPPNPPPKPKAKVPGRGIVLRNGSFLAGNVESIDDSSLKFAVPGMKPLNVFTHQLAWVIFRPPRNASVLEGIAGQTGVVLENGDFFAGEIQAIKDRRLKVSSVLFGQKSYGLDGSETTMWILAQPSPKTTPYELRTTDGSVILARTLIFEKGSLVVTDASLGTFPLPPASVAELQWNGK